MSHAFPFDNPDPPDDDDDSGGSYSVINVTESPYNATGNGTTDDRSSIQAAFTAATSSGSSVYIPPGTYIIGRSLSGNWGLDLPANVTVFGVRGQTWLKMAPGVSATPYAVLRINGADNACVHDIGIHGNWGNGYTTVTSSSHLATLPQATINVEDTTEFPSSGTFTIVGSAGAEVITYTGKTSTTFTGCSGGTGVIVLGTELGRLDDNTGINHTTQTDPQSHGIMVRGSKNVSISRVLFRQIYGDAIWMGFHHSSVSKPTKDITISEIDVEVCARDGVAFGQWVDGATLRDASFRAIYAQAVDLEPVSQPVRNVLVERVRMSLWWNPGNVNRTTNAPLAIVGGNFLANSTAIHARGVTVRDCVIPGAVIIQSATDVLLERNRITCDFSGTSVAPVVVQMHCDGVTVRDNWIYDRTTKASDHPGAITVSYYASSAANAQPAGIKISGNKIHARNGRRGIEVVGTGSHAYSSTAIVADETNTATATSLNSMTRTGAGWTTNAWIGWMVRIGNATATVQSNTSEVLTLFDPWTTATSGQNCWKDPTGNSVATPSAGTYLLFKPDGVVVVEDNEIDCSDDGNSAGAAGIGVEADRAGMRVIVRDNRILNATGPAIEVDCTDAARTILDLKVEDNYAWDNQGTPTCTSVVNFTPTSFITSLTLRNNHAGTGITNVINGLTTGTWLIHDGEPAQWGGFGSPESVVTATVGSTYLRVDGGVGTTLYLKESGTGNTGWVQHGGARATGTITCTTKANYADTDYMTIGDGLVAAKLYEFDTAGDGVTAGRVQVNISTDTTATEVATRLKTAIETNQPALSISQASGVLTLTHKLMGVVGNVTITENVTHASHTVTGLSGGVNNPG